MFKNNKRILALLMAFMMMLSVLPIDFTNAENVKDELNKEIGEEISLYKEGLTKTSGPAIDTKPSGETTGPAIEVESTKDEIIDTMLQTISEEFKDSSGDWQVMELSAYGKAGELTNKAEFLENAKKVPSKNYLQATDLERITISLTSLGYDTSNFEVEEGEKVNLIEKIANWNKEKDTPSLGTIYGYIYALQAYDSGDYKLPDDAYWAREKIIDYLIEEAQNNDGGWSFSLDNTKPSDGDATGMVIAALSPYMDIEKVKTAVDEGVQILSDIYKRDCGYISWGSTNSNSASMVVVGLSALGIDSDLDTRFIKDEVSLLDHLLSFRSDDNRFGYTDNKYNSYATEQGFRALIAYNGFKTSNKAFNIYKFDKADGGKPDTNLPGTDKPDIEEPGGGSTGGDTVTSKDIEVSFKLIGDSKHGTPEKHEKFETWIKKTKYTVQEKSTVKDVFVKVLKSEDISYKLNGGKYVSEINGLSEMDNGPNSGWKYSINKREATVGFDDYELEDGDDILWYYTDDYTKDSDFTSSASGGTSLDKEEITTSVLDEETKEEIEFKDIADDYWAKDYISYLVDKNVLEGKSKDNFMPEDKITRAEFLTILFRISGQKTVDNNNTFLDIKESDWFASAVSFGIKAGISDGVSKTEFAPNSNITREQMAVMIVRFLNYMKFELSIQNPEAFFEDNQLIADYARDAVASMQKAGIISGRSDNGFYPKDNTTRAEAAKILSMIMQEMNK